MYFLTISMSPSRVAGRIALTHDIWMGSSTDAKHRDRWGAEPSLRDLDMPVKFRYCVKMSSKVIQAIWAHCANVA